MLALFTPSVLVAAKVVFTSLVVLASGPFAFTAADLQGLERGLVAEAEAVKAAEALGRAARTPAERSRAAQAGWETATIPVGAKAAGMPVARYEATRETVFEVLQTLDFQGKIDGPMEIDTSAVGPEMKAKLRRDAMAGLAPASAAALRARLASVVKAWNGYIRLVAVNG